MARLEWMGAEWRSRSTTQKLHCSSVRNTFFFPFPGCNLSHPHSSYWDLKVEGSLCLLSFPTPFITMAKHDGAPICNTAQHCTASENYFSFSQLFSFDLHPLIFHHIFNTKLSNYQEHSESSSYQSSLSRPYAGSLTVDRGRGLITNKCIKVTHSKIITRTEEGT